MKKNMRQNWMKKMLKAVLVTAVTVSMAACGGGGGSSDGDSQAETAEVPADGVSTVYVQLKGDFANFQPSTKNQEENVSTRLSYYETLFQWDYNGECTPLLAESYEWVDGTHIKIKLHENIHTHDGNPVTANDVLWSLKYASESPEFMRHTQNINFDDTEVLDDYTIQIAINTPNVLFLNDLSRIDITAEKSFNDSPDHMLTCGVGTGPYKMVSYTPGVEFVLEKYDDYWNKDAQREDQLQNVDRIVYKFIPEETQRSIELESGGVDILTTTPMSDVDRFMEDDNYEVSEFSLTQTQALYFNCSDQSVCSSKELRQAISYAIDNTAMVAGIYNGHAHPAVSVVMPGVREYKEEMENTWKYAFNQEKAKELLAEAGYEPGELTLRLATGDNSSWKSIAQILQAELAEIGINVEIQIHDTGTYMSVFSDFSQWDLFVNEYAAKGTIMFYFYNQMNNNTRNATGWQNDEFQSLLAEAIQTDDQAAIDQMVEIYEEEIPARPILNLTRYYTYRKGIENMRIKDDYTMLAGDLTYTDEANSWLYD